MKKPNKALILILGLFLVMGFLFYPQKTKAYSWTQVNDDGFGDAANWGAIRLHVYNGYIYAGTGNDNGAYIYRSSDGTTWETITNDGFGDVANDEFHAFANFGNYIYASTLKMVAGAGEVWRSQTGAVGTWAQVSTDGFGDANNTGMRAMTVFGNYLYAGTENTTTGTELWRSATGNTGDWTQANADAFGAADSDLRALKVYNNQLYAGTQDTINGARTLRSSDGTTWTPVVTGGFDGTDNTNVLFLEEFGSYLYAGTINTTTGAEIWRSATGNSGTWSRVVNTGFGTATNTWISYQGAVVNNIFWAGTRKAGGGGAAQLYYSTDGTTWTQEGTDGFGDANNYALFAITFKEMLYIAFSNATSGAEVWRTGDLATLSLLPDSLPSGTVGTPYSQTLQPVSGTSPYTFSDDGFLPPGLSLSSDGVLSGTPTQEGTNTFTVTVTDSGTPAQTYSKTYTLVISGILPETGSANTNQNYNWPLIGGVAWFALSLSALFFLKRLKAKDLQ